MLDAANKAFLVLALAVTASGCSTGMKVAPSDPSQRNHRTARECTDNILLPVLDTLAAGVGAYNIGFSAAADDKVSYGSIDIDKGVGLALGITQLVGFGAAASYGYIQFARCQTLRREQNIGTRKTEPEPPSPMEPPPPGASQAATPPPPPVAMAPGSADDHDATEGPGRSAGSSTAPSATDELPSWSAFRRVPLPRPASTVGAPYDGPVR